MKKIYMALSVFVALVCSAQVGINTDDPQATLDVNGNLIIRTVVPATTAGSYDFLVSDPTSLEVKKVTGNLNGSSVNTTIAKAEIKSGISLLTLGFGGFDVIDFGAPDILIDTGSNFSDLTDSYTVPSTGIYEITYDFRYGTGVQVAAVNLGVPPSIAILRNLSTTPTVLDYRVFSGATVPLLISIVISDSNIKSFYQLNQNDELSFGFNTGGIPISLLGSSFASVKIRKISD